MTGSCQTHASSTSGQPKDALLQGRSMSVHIPSHPDSTHLLCPRVCWWGDKDITGSFSQCVSEQSKKVDHSQCGDADRIMHSKWGLELILMGYLMIWGQLWKKKGQETAPLALLNVMKRGVCWKHGKLGLAFSFKAMSIGCLEPRLNS